MDDPIVEFAVVDDRGRICGLIPQIFRTREEVDGYFSWLTGERREQMRREADANEASGFEGGNAAWYHWHVGTGSSRDGGEKARTYRIVTREITPWRTVDE